MEEGMPIAAVLGAVVAGALYYFLDREGAEELMSDLKDKAKNAYDEASEQIAGLTKEMNGARV